MPEEHPEAAVYDVIVCGGGLAGLALARQLNLGGTAQSILVLDKLVRPLPDSTLKVGESTIELGAHYYAKTLQLEDHLRTEQLEKLGLRYFYEGGRGEFSARPEFGVSQFLPSKSYQLDRGRLENHLRELAVQAGVDLREGVRIEDVELGPRGMPHAVRYVENGAPRVARGRWVVDATGRRRLLQTKLGLTKGNAGCFNSAWFRVEGRVSVDDWVPPEATEWHARVREDRWFSTTHLMGRGYWVWLIPLSPGNTSIGIVASDDIHPFGGYATLDRAMAWLETYEPLVAERLAGHKVLDFLRLRDYSYTSRQVFSADRWACVGEAAVFADPYYSMGSNFISIANGFVQRFLELDARGALDDAYVEHANRLFLGLNDMLTDTIHRPYAFHDNAPLMALKTVWDFCVVWTTIDPRHYDGIYLDVEQTAALNELLAPVAAVHARVLKLFEDWARVPSPLRLRFLDYAQDLPTLLHLHRRNLAARHQSDFATVYANLSEAARHIEDMAHVVFAMALRDVLPGRLPLVEEQGGWINVAAIGLDPLSWERDGLFEPRTHPRDYRALAWEVGRLFTRAPQNTSAEVKVPA